MYYQEWERCVPGEITGGVLWKVQVYRLALFLSDLSWTDATKLVRDQRTRALSANCSARSDQLVLISRKATVVAAAKIGRVFTNMHSALRVKAATGIIKVGMFSEKLLLLIEFIY
jgi:hypothetical protein